MILPYTHPRTPLDVVYGRLLLVEGKDEVNLFTRLVQRCVTDDEVTISVQIESVGKESFRKKFGAIVEAARSKVALQAIGIVRDADEDADGAFVSVCDSIRNFGYMPPGVHGSFSNAEPAMGVFIVPNGAEPGAIESICRESVLGTVASQCVEDYLTCLDEHDALLSTNRDKSFAHAYLAAMRDPVARVGEGALQGVWDLESPAFSDLRQFVANLASHNGR